MSACSLKINPFPIPEPIPEPAPEPAPEPVPEPAPEVVPEPIPEPTPAPVSEPEPAPDYTYQKDEFMQRYNQLNSRVIEDGPQQTMNVESGELFNDWDVLLNDVYKYLKTIKSSSEFKVIEKDEIAWIKQKEAAIEKSANEFYGGSMAPLAANMTAIEYTKQRCEYLISLIY